MNNRGRALARGLTGLGFALLAATIVLVWARGPGPLPGAGYTRNEALLFLLTTATAPLVIGGLIASRFPGNPYGWVWLAMGLTAVGIELGEGYAVLGLVVEPGSLPAPMAFAAAGDISWLLFVATLPLAVLLFPTGRLPSPRWRWLPVSMGVLVVLTLIVGWAVPGSFGVVPIERPFGVEGPIGEIATIVFGLFVFALVLCLVPAVASVVVRFRRARGRERLQIKWLAFGGLVAVLCGIVAQFDPPGMVDLAVEGMTIIAPAAGVAIAILRHQLYDIDRIINRTIVYALVTGSVVAAYTGTVFVAGTLAAGSGDNVTVAVATLVAAGVFRPVLRRVQEFVDRRFYRRKFDARRTVEAFGRQLRDETDLSMLAGGLVSVVRDTMQPEHVTLWLAPTGADR